MTIRLARFWMVVLVCVPSAGLASGSAALAASDQLPSMAAHAAENMARFLKARNKDATNVVVHPLPTLKSTVANAVTQRIGEALKARNIRLADNVEFALDVQPKIEAAAAGSGSAPQSKVQIPALRFQVSFVDRNGEKMVDLDFGARMSDGPELRALLGLSGVPRQQLIPARAGAGGSIVRATADGPFGIEIVVNGAERPVRIEDGFGYVNLGLDQEYSIRIHNNSGYEAAVAVKVDGLDVFHFSELREPDGARKGEPRYQWYILKPGTNTVDIRGWHVDDSRSKAFKVGLREDSLAAKAGLTSEIGVIHAQFFASWEANAELTMIPPDEPARKNFGGPAQRPSPKTLVERHEKRVCRDGILTDFVMYNEYTTVTTPGFIRVGTTFGSDLITNTQGVSRVIGFPRDSVAVRYRMPQ